MNFWLERFHKHLACAGFNNIRIKNIDRLLQALENETDDAFVQLLDASLVAGSEHLRFAVLNALNAFEGQISISNGLAIEILLYASARRQIKEALRLIGVRPSTTKVAVVVLAANLEQASAMLKVVSRLLRGNRDDSVIDLSGEKLANLRKLFGISDAELEAKTEHKGLETQAHIDLVIEHMALLVAHR